MITLATGYNPGDSPPGVPLIGYDNKATAITASSAATGFPASNMLNPATHLFWKANALTSQTITITLGGAANYVAIAKHNLLNTTIAFSNGTDSIPATAVTSNAPIILRFPSLSASITLTIGAAATAAQIAVIYAGQLLVLERGVKVDAQHLDLPHARKTSIVNGMSESGNFLGRIQLNEYREGKAEFAWFTPIWYHSNFEPFVAAAVTKPFFWAWNPSDFPDETSFAWLTDDVQPATDPATRRMAATLSMRSII